MLAEETPTETTAGLEHAGVHSDTNPKHSPGTSWLLRFPWGAACTRVQSSPDVRLAVLHNCSALDPSASATEDKNRCKFYNLQTQLLILFFQTSSYTFRSFWDVYSSPHPPDLACSRAVYEFAWQPDINIQPTSKQSLECSELQCFCAQPYNKSELATRQGINPLSLAQSII